MERTGSEDYQLVGIRNLKDTLFLCGVNELISACGHSFLKMTLKALVAEWTVQALDTHCRVYRITCEYH